MRGGRDTSVVGEPGQEDLDGIGVKRTGMLELMKTNESPAPVGIRILGTLAVVQESDALP
jgi:hypothetical protein